MPMKQIMQAAEQQMQKTHAHVVHELSKIRTGRASSTLLEAIAVTYYGSASTLSQVASITVEDASTLAVTPWEKSMVPAIEKAIRAANLGLNPVTAGQIVRVPLPPLTEERRKELVKLIRGLIEEGKVAIRTGRREANMHTKELLKAKKITEDEERRLEDNIQKLTDKHVVDLEKIQLTKENELMKI